MADIKLFEGTWTRQVLKGKRKVRITYIPDDVTQQSLFEKIRIGDQSSPDVIVKTFQQSDPVGGFPGVGMAQFIDCIQGKRNMLGNDFNYPLAFSECLPQMTA